MRVTQGMLSSQVLYDIQGNYQRLSNLQTEASSGKKINTPSDNPIGVQSVMQYTNETTYDAQYQQNAQNAQSTLNFTASTMTEAQNVLQRARDLAVQGSSSTNSTNDLKDLASEVGQLYSQMVTIANTQYNGQYIFNGENSATAPYPIQAENMTPDQAVANASTDPSQSTPQSGSVFTSVGNGVNLAVNVPGSTFFGDKGSATNAFSLMGQLYTALDSGDATQVGKVLSGLDSRLSAMSQSQADVGARVNRAQLMQNRMSDLSNNVTTQLSNVQDADLASVITKLNSAMAVEQESLKVGAQALPQTLVDFLK